MIAILHQSGQITHTHKEEGISEVAELLPKTMFFFVDGLEVLREKLTGERNG